MAPIGISDVRSKRCYFHLRLVTGLVRDDHNAELCSDGQAIREKLLHALRNRVGGNVEIGRLAADFERTDAIPERVRLFPE